MNQNTAMTASRAVPQSGSAVALLLSALFGLGMVFAVGMAQADALHDAAHDVRHANGFPCH